VDSSDISVQSLPALDFLEREFLVGAAVEFASARVLQIAHNVDCAKAVATVGYGSRPGR
jgi:hypothetical protein